MNWQHHIETSARATRTIHAWLDPTTTPSLLHRRDLVLQEGARTPQRRRSLLHLRPGSGSPGGATLSRVATAAVIGVVLAGLSMAAVVLTPERPDAAARGAVTSAPSPSVGLELEEEIEPGVVKVGDQVTHSMTFGPDGTLWYADFDEDGSSGLNRLSAVAEVLPGTPPVLGGVREATPAPDGAIWALTAAGPARWDGQDWQLRGGGSIGEARALLVQRDGSMLVPKLAIPASGSTPSIGGASLGVDHVNADGSGSSTARRLTLDATDGSWSLERRAGAWMGFASLSEGDVLVALPFGATAPSGATGRLWRWGEERQTWREVDLPAVAKGVRPWAVATDDDDAVWVYLSELPPERSESRALARLRDGEWMVWTDQDGVPLASEVEVTSELAIGHDGTLWMPVMGPQRCAGLASFDGIDWRSYLDGTCVTAVTVAPDGRIWTSGFDPTGEEGESGLYRIDPERATQG